MRSDRRRYIFLGLGLMVGGGLFALVAYFIVDYMPLAALGVAVVVLGAVAVGLGRTLPRVSLEVGQVLLEGGLDNIAAFIEELGLRSPALYMPTSLTDGVARALIPMYGSADGIAIQRRPERRLIVRFGPGEEDLGLLVATPGSATLALLDGTGPSSSEELERVLSSLLVGALDLADGVSVLGDGDVLRIELSRPTLSTGSHPAYTVLGSPQASIVATVAAEVLGRPVSVASEDTERGRHFIELQLHEEVRL